MCRIAGVVKLNKGTALAKETDVQACRILDRMRHGGPDADGTMQTGPVSFFHCRLALLDASPTGAQPMRRGNTVLSYNGEVYNYLELKKELTNASEKFRGNSDTEVILAAIGKWGKAALNRFRGMFALALWNESEKTLLLARDPLGIKPLYYSHTEDHFLFASELKALLELPGHDASINHAALPEYLRRGYISAPNTIYQNTYKLEPGEWVEFSLQDGNVAKGAFYQLENKVSQNSQRQSLTPKQNFKACFEESCQRRLLADFPVGVLLSGGVDSSLIAATVSGLTEEPVKTFTMGFDNPAFNEAPRAAAIAKHLKTDHTEFSCTAEDFLRLIPAYAEIYDEPFGDASGIATHLLTAGTSQEVKCCLGGDGGDELFGGYAKYRATLNFDRYAKSISPNLRKLLAKAIRTGRPDRIGKMIRKVKPDLSNPEEKLYKLSESISATSTESFFQRASDYSDESILYRLGVLTPKRPVKYWASHELLTKMAIEDLQNYMEGDLLVKVDRASMNNGLEVRLPFLDTDLVAFALNLKPKYRLSGRDTKVLPRQLLAEYLPQKLTRGPKKGFAIPLDQWLRTKLVEPLKDMAADQTFSARFRFRPGAVEGIVNDYLSPLTYINVYPVWFLFVLHQWHIRWGE